MKLKNYCALMADIISMLLGQRGLVSPSISIIHSAHKHEQIIQNRMMMLTIQAKSVSPILDKFTSYNCT